MGGPPFFALRRRAEASKPLWNRHQERRPRGGAGRVRAFSERLTRRIFAMWMGRRWEVISAIISGGRVVRVGVVFSAILGLSDGGVVRIGVVFSAILGNFSLWFCQGCCCCALGLGRQRKKEREGQERADLAFYNFSFLRRT